MGEIPVKASVLSLCVVTAALGGSSIYLWNQLQGERERAGGLASSAADLKARIARLETARAEFEGRRLAGTSTFGAESAGGVANPPRSPAGSVADEPDAPRMTPWGAKSAPAGSAAMHRMMRAQIRASNKRLYADVGAKLGLTRDEANKLIDLLTDQQVGGIQPFRDGAEAAESQDAWAEKQGRLQAEIAALLGDDKVLSLQEYQKSLPARQELEMLTRQLEGYDAPLNEDQRKGLLKVMVEERERVPTPDYVDGADMEEFQKTRTAWEEDYHERVASQARGILDNQQIDAYTEYQQAQKDMRAQFGALLPAGPRRVIRGASGANVTFTQAAPAGGTIMSAEAVFISAPPESRLEK
jgi:hypothetical protein